MRKRLSEVEKTTVVPYDPVNEQIIIAALLTDDDARKFILSRLSSASFFQAPEHVAVFNGLLEMKRRNLDFDLATLSLIAGEDFKQDYVYAIIEARPEPPVNLAFHIDTLLWDNARINAASGPVAAFLEGLKDPRESPERVKALAGQVASAFAGYEERKFLFDPEQLVTQQMQDIRNRMNGIACHPYGIDGLDFYENGEHRMIPGTQPGQTTVICGLSGSGKSTLVASIALSLARMKRKVLFGAWEQSGGVTLEQIAVISMNLDRNLLRKKDGLNEDQLIELEKRMRGIGKYVRFMANPFQRKASDSKEKQSNDRNLDIIQGYISDTGCNVFIADLWRRCLVRREPDDEERAFERQQSIAEDEQIHQILLHQLRSKDLEQRKDKRPTREGMKGSGILTEAPDTILGVHRPGLWNSKIPDNKIEIHVLKQRFGKWPMAVEFDFSPSVGSITGGITIDYEHPGDGATSQAQDIPGSKLNKFLGGENENETRSKPGHFNRGKMR